MRHFRDLQEEQSKVFHQDKVEIVGRIEDCFVEPCINQSDLPVW